MNNPQHTGGPQTRILKELQEKNRVLIKHNRSFFLREVSTLEPITVVLTLKFEDEIPQCD